MLLNVFSPLHSQLSLFSSLLALPKAPKVPPGIGVEGGTPGQHPRVFPVGQRAGRFSIQDQCLEQFRK